MKGPSWRGREPAEILSWQGRWHCGQTRTVGLAVSIVSVAELAFRHLPAFLRLDTKRRYRAGFKALEAYFLASFVTETITAVVDTRQRRIDLSQQFSFTVPCSQLKTELGFLRGAIVRIREIGRLVLHMVDGTIYLIHEFVLPRRQNGLEMP